MPICTADAPLVEVDGEAEVVDEPEEPEPDPEVLAALLLDGLPAVEEAVLEPVKVAMLMVVFLDMAVPVPALIVPTVPTVLGATGMVVDAVPFAESVLLTYALGLAVAEDTEAELTADAVAP